MTIGLALVGGGIFVKEAHLPAIQDCDDLELVGIYSRSLSTAKSLGISDVALYSDESDKNFEQLLKDPNVQAVIIALPILTQPKYIKAAIEAGKHVLSEKPVAGDVKPGRELVEWYRKGNFKTLWGVAEQKRYSAALLKGASQAKSMGRLLGFQVQVHKYVEQDGKYYLTPWRKTPEYQGGFLLDGGVHFIAALRLLLGEEEYITRVSAFTTKLQEHLPPIDTLTAVAQTKSGAIGTISISFGTTFKEDQYSVAFEKGTITVKYDQVDTDTNGKVDTKNFSSEDVKEEVKSFAHGVNEGRLDPMQSPEQALADLEVLEAIFKSGEQNGAPVEIDEPKL